MDEQQAIEAINAALPATGDVPYEQLYDQLQSARKEQALKHFFRLRKSGQLVIRMERTPGGLVMHVGRQSA